VLGQSSKSNSEPVETRRSQSGLSLAVAGRSFYFGFQVRASTSALIELKEDEMLFMIEWQINHDQKMETFGAFGGMSADDDAAVEQAHGFKQIGRWSDLANGRGVAIVEADSADAVHGFGMMWTGALSSLNVTPVLDDAAARSVINGYLATQ
jgi:hypothetical protein